MIKLYQKIPILWKFVVLYLFLSLAIAAVFYYHLIQTTDWIFTRFNTHVSPFALLSQEVIRVLSFVLLVGFAGLIIFYLEINAFIKRLNGCLKEALLERKLAHSFQDFYKGESFEDITHNINALFSFFRSFDNMKSTRISLETSSIKLLMNSIAEGVILVNQEKVVTHINHLAESMLRLIPGEIIGQIISRKINSPIVLENLDNALESEHKVTNHRFSVKEGSQMNLNIFPIKNKFGEVIRALIILERV